MKKGTIKKKVVNLAVALLTVSIMAAAGIHVATEMVYYDEASLEETYELQRELGIMTDYRSRTGRRLRHNNDEPIYVSISNEFTPEQKEAIVQQLDHIFGVVSAVNDKYRYKIVENVDDVKYFNKATISFKIEEFSGKITGTAGAWPSLSSLSSKGVYTENCDVRIDRSSYKDNNKMPEFKSIVLHELFHCFGARDIYGEEEKYHSSMMNCCFGGRILTPNDQKLLVTTYAKSLSKMTESEKTEYVKLIKENIFNYEESYFRRFTDEIIIPDRVLALDTAPDKNYIIEELSRRDIPEDFDCYFYDKNIVDSATKIELKVRGDKYKLSFYDESDRLVTKASGAVYRVDNEVYLSNAKIYGFQGNDFSYIDLHFYTVGDNYYLDTYNNGIMSTNEIISLDNNVEV